MNQLADKILRLVFLAPIIVLLMQFRRTPLLFFLVVLIGLAQFLVIFGIVEIKQRAEFYFVSTLGLVVLGILLDMNIVIAVVLIGVTIIFTGPLYSARDNQTPIYKGVTWLEIIVVIAGLIMTIIGYGIRIELGLWVVIVLALAASVTLKATLSIEK